MKKITIFTLVVTLLAACSKENMEINPDSTSQNSATPSVQKTFVARAFSANISAVADPSSPPTSCSGVIPFVAPDFTLSGTAIHLGQLNGLSRLHHVSCDVDVNTALFTTHVSGQIVAANGDVINYTGDDVVNVVSLLTGTGTTGPITGTWTITGGSGRFEGATGTLTVNGIVDLVGGSFTCDCVGTITY